MGGSLGKKIPADLQNAQVQVALQQVKVNAQLLQPINTFLARTGYRRRTVCCHVVPVRREHSALNHPLGKLRSAVPTHRILVDYDEPKKFNEPDVVALKQAQPNWVVRQVTSGHLTSALRKCIPTAG